MYSVPNNVRQVLDGPAQAYSLRGICGGRDFSGDRDVLQGTFRISNQISEATEVSLGGVYVGQMSLTFSDRFATTRGGWQNKTITAEIGVLVDGEFYWIPAPGGTYYIQDATWTQDGLQVIAYDAMSKFDKPITLNNASGEAYDFLNFACRDCDVALGMTKAEVRALVNGSETLGLYPTDSVQTWRDMLSWLAQATCSFATINREGELVLRRFPATTSPKTSIDTSRRFMGASFSDFETFYTKITVEDIADNIVQSYSLGDDGLTMNLGANPFLQYGLNSTVVGMRRAVLEGLSGFKFSPFNISKLLDPTYDLGDCIEFPGGIGRGCSGIVMSYSLDMYTIALQGFGENPALSNVATDAEKAASGAAGSAKSKSIVYNTFENIQSINIGTTETEVVSMRFYTTEETTVTMWAEIDALIQNSPQRVDFTYYLDGEKVTYSPREHVTGNGWHLFTLNYYLLNIDPSILHEWKITAKTNIGTIAVEPGDIHFLMMGQGLASEKTWSGLIEVSDRTAINITADLDVNITGELNKLELQSPAGPILVGSAEIGLGGSLELNIREVLDIVSKMDVYERITEDGETRLTEEGGIRLTEGDIV